MLGISHSNSDIPNSNCLNSYENLMRNTHRRIKSEPSYHPLLIEGDTNSKRPLSRDSESECFLRRWQRIKDEFTNARINDRAVSHDMERENMHLYLSEMLINAIEWMKWRSIEEALNAKDSETKSVDSPLMHEVQDNATTSSAGLLDELLSVESEASIEARLSELTAKADEGETESDDENSAEKIAASLLRHLATLKSDTGNNIKWLVSFADAPQSLLPLPNNVSENGDEISVNGQVIYYRGFFDWAPPRKQWIFTLHPSFSNTTCNALKMLDKQNGRCAGCGLKVGDIYAKRMRFCDYYGKLFCQRCHQGTKMRTPARIIHQWNFKSYPLCDLARRFLMDNYSQPVINASAVSTRFYKNHRRLRSVRNLRIKLVHIWCFVKTCSEAEKTVTKLGNLKSLFESVPSHFLHDADVYSMADLENIHRGNLIESLSFLVCSSQYHVEHCELCRAKGFICELCSKCDLLFPFQLDKVCRCSYCGSVSHAKCALIWSKSAKPCPKCTRIRKNSERHRRCSVESLFAEEL